MDSNPEGHSDASKGKQKPRYSEAIQGPLIPSNIIDEASQRVFVVSFFVLIQCWKAYDIILLKSEGISGSLIGLAPLNSFTFVAKYAVMDGLFLWLLPILNIQYLVYSPLKTFLLTLILNGLTFFLASDAMLPLVSNLMLPVWKILFSRKELTLFGDSVNSNRLIDPNEHFKGRYTIQFLPDSSARFNPFHFDNLCLDPISQSSLQMPIEFNTTTELGYLQLQHITPLNEQKLLNYTHHDLSRLLKRDYSHLNKYQLNTKTDDRIFYVEIPISDPGLYRINKVSDKKGISIRTYKSDFLISHCPSAEFVYSSLPKSYQDYKCIGENVDSDDIDIKLPLVYSFGVSPIRLSFENRLNGKKFSSFNVTINEENIQEANLNVKKLKDLSRIKSHSITRNVLEQEIFRNANIFPKLEAGKLEFQLVEVVDGLGNIRRYNPSSKDKDVWYSIELKKAPRIELIDTDQQDVLLVNGTKTLSLRSQNVKEEDFPLEVDFAYFHPHDQLLSTNFTKSFENLAALSKGIECDKPGTYTVIMGKSKYCPCDTLVSKSIYIERALPPLIEVTAEPVMDKCVGMTGYKFDFELSGKPPFIIQYHVYQNRSDGSMRPVYNERGLTSRLLKTFDKNYKFEYRPPREGNYVIVFDSFKDFNYHRNPVLLDKKKHTYLTYFNQRSRASFFSNKGELSKVLRSCRDEFVSIPLYLKGNPPFNFEYDIVNIDTGEKLIKTTKVSNISDEIYNIVTPRLSAGGNYEVILLEAKDNLSCPVEFDRRESIKIRSRADIPEILINDDSKYKNVKIVEGDSYKIPLKLKSSVSSSSSDVLEYSITNLHNSSDSSTRILRNSNSLIAKEEGIYKLSSFKNGGCLGKISSENSVTVSYYNRPNLTLVTEDQKLLKQHLEENDLFVHIKPLCQGSLNQIKLNLEGVKPFVIDYDIELPNGVESRSMTANDHTITINLPTTLSGQYVHHFKGIYDKLYTREKVARISKRNENLPSVRYEVNPSPRANFARKDNFIQVCETNFHNLDEPISKIPISLVGEYPFKIKASLKHESTGVIDTFVLENIVEPEIDMNKAKIIGKEHLLHETMEVGEHILTIDEVTDANGCSEKEFSSLNNFIISVTEVPNISKVLKKAHYCVGDHILYNMSGISPFMVYYKFNNKLQKAELGYRFQRLASKSGELSIEALLDSSASQCLVNFTNSQEKYDALKLKVYDLPSVEINQGSYVVQDIHEGDQTEIKFTFTGVPPFKLVYTRTSEQIDPIYKHKKNIRKDKHSKIIVETKTIEDIWDHEYIDLVSLEGTYEAIEVHDAYCIARRDANYP